jgi:molecular chaperone DnaK (HSP70)
MPAMGGQGYTFGGYTFGGDPFVPLQSGVTAAAVGIETRGGVFTPLIQPGTTVPCAVTEVFTTADDYQPSIKIRVFQGNSSAVADNHKLGDYELLITAAPRGVPQISITFDVDVYGRFGLFARTGGGGDVQVVTA